MSADAEIPASRTGRIRLYGAVSIAALAALIAFIPALLLFHTQMLSSAL